MELMKLMEDWKGYDALSEVKKPENWEAQLKETIELLNNTKGLPLYKHEYLMREALTTSDFPYLFGDVLDRQVLASYKAVDPVWKAFVKSSTVNDFKTAYRFAITGGDQYLSEVAEKGEYLASERTESKYELAVKKYGRQFDISWETIINDDLGALRDTPERFARAVTRTEHRIVTELYADDATLYQLAGGQANRVTTALSIASLETGLETMAAFTDANGEAIQNRAKFLVVPPVLEMTARQILTSTTKMWSDNAAGPAAYPTANVVAQMGLTLIIDPYLPIIDTTGSGGTGWYLFSNPKDIAAIEVAHLKGHERPEICMKASDKVTVGGGAINAMSGDFKTDNVLYRVREVFGGVTEDWRATYMGGSD